MKTIQKSQGGVVILEVLVSIVIFAVGVLGIVGLQAVTAKAGINARFRTEAAALSDELVARAQTWTDLSTLVTNFTGTTAAGGTTTGGTEYQSWSNDRLARATTGLPGAQATVTFPAPLSVTPGAGVLMTVEISWQAPGGDSRSSHTTVAALPGTS